MVYRLYFHPQIDPITGLIPISGGGTGADTAAGARTNLGLGTIAIQNADAVAVTGGSITGITDLAIADGGTGASTVATARLALATTFSASKGGTDQTGIADSTPTKITFATENWDIGSYYASSTYTPAAGYYRLNAGLYVSGLNVGTRCTVRINKNGSLHKNLASQPADVTGAAEVNGSIVVTANGTDTFEVFLLCSTATTATVYGGTEATYFQGEAI